MDEDPYADIRADIEAEQAERAEKKERRKELHRAWLQRQAPEYRKHRSEVATQLHREWLARQPQEVKDQRRQRLKDLEKENRKYWTAYKLRYRRTIKAKLVEMFGDRCHDCGGTFPHVCYDFHHTDPAKKTKIIAVMYQHKWSTVLQEVQDCVMICANCHRIRHEQRAD